MRLHEIEAQQNHMTFICEVAFKIILLKIFFYYTYFGIDILKKKYLKKCEYCICMMEQKGMTFDHDFCYFILLFSSLFFCSIHLFASTIIVETNPNYLKQISSKVIFIWALCKIIFIRDEIKR